VNILYLFFKLDKVGLLGQSFQRMAIPKGIYKLSAKGSKYSAKDVAAYCVDFSRAAPTKGVGYSNLLEGSATVIFEGTNQVKSLKEAIRAGEISIEGTRWASVDAFLNSIDNTQRQFLSELIEIQTKPIIDEIRSSAEYLSLSPIERLQVERMIKEEFSLKSFLQKNPEFMNEAGNWSQLRLVNHTNHKITIRADKNLQVGTKTENIARRGLEEFDFKNGKYGEAQIQERAWIQQTKDDYNRLKRIGEYEGELPHDKDILNDAKATFKKFQEKYDLTITGELNEITERKIIEIENKIMDDFIILDENPNNLDDLGKAIGEYQKRNGLEVDNNLNIETLSKLTDQNDQLSQQLSSTIHNIGEKELREKIEIYKDIKKLNNKEAIADKEFLESLQSDVNYYVSIDGSYSPFQKSDVSIKNVEGVEIKKLETIRYTEDANVHLILDEDLPSTIETLNKKLDWNYDLNEISIFPFTKNSDTRELLKGEFGKNWIKSSLKSEKEIAKRLRKSKRKTILTVGHIENGFYVENGIRIISLETLNKYAKMYNLNIFHLGCGTAIEGVGTTASINTVKTVDALISSIKTNDNFKDFFLGFSKKGIGPDNTPVDLIVDGTTFSDKGYAQFKAYQKGSIIGAATAGGGILLYYLLSDEETNNEE
jgi:hypothetical protein